MTYKPDVREHGFTLLEVLVAFVIAALALGALSQGAAGGLQSARVSGHYQEALSRARSRLAALGTATVPGEQHGDDGGGFSWQVRVARLATAGRAREGIDPERPGRAVLLGVTVRISWRMDGGEREVALATERVGLALPDPP
jgi:general secretion pathway protein I